MNPRLLPFAGFVLVLALLGFGIWWSQHHDPREVPSPLIGKAAPAFALPSLQDSERVVTNQDLAGAPYLLNVFASWCYYCKVEHPTLMKDARQLGIRIVGFNYKDDPDDAKRWIAKNGDPYDVIIADRSGDTAINFGVTGAPETFLVDAHGIVRYKFISPLTPEVVDKELVPRIAALTAQAK